MGLIDSSHENQHIIAESSGHLINKDAPELLIEAIREMVMRIKRT